MLLLVGTSHAANPESTAAAEALFREGIRLLEQGSVDLALDKLQASQRLDPGVVTLMYIADCHRELGKTATAWAEFLEASSVARQLGQVDRAEQAMAEAKEIEPTLSRLVVEVAEEARAPGIEVRRDDLVLEPGTWNTPLPVDPGTHRVTVSAPGHVSWSTIVEVRPGGDLARVRVPLLEKVQPAADGSRPEKSRAPVSGRTGSVQNEREAQRRSKASPARRILVGGLGAVALTGIGIGTGYWIRAERIEADAAPDCRSGAPLRCNQDGLDTLDRAREHARVAYASFAMSGVALVTGATLEIVPRVRRRPSTRRSPAPASLQVSPAQVRMVFAFP